MTPSTRNDSGQRLPAPLSPLRTIGISGPPGMIVGRFRVAIAPRLPRQAPACRAAVTHPARRLAVRAGPRRCFPVVGKDLRVALTGSGPGVGSGAIQMTARRRRSAWSSRPSPRCWAGGKNGVPIAAPARSSPRPLPLHRSNQWPDRPVTHIHGRESRISSQNVGGKQRRTHGFDRLLEIQ
jgi:hypothetical protein